MSRRGLLDGMVQQRGESVHRVDELSIRQRGEKPSTNPRCTQSSVPIAAVERNKKAGSPSLRVVRDQNTRWSIIHFPTPAEGSDRQPGERFVGLPFVTRGRSCHNQRASRGFWPCSHGARHDMFVCRGGVALPPPCHDEILLRNCRPVRRRVAP